MAQLELQILQCREWIFADEFRFFRRRLRVLQRLLTGRATRQHRQSQQHLILDQRVERHPVVLDTQRVGIFQHRLFRLVTIHQPKLESQLQRPCVHRSATLAYQIQRSPNLSAQLRHILSATCGNSYLQGLIRSRLFAQARETRNCQRPFQHLRLGNRSRCAYPQWNAHTFRLPAERSRIIVTCPRKVKDMQQKITGATPPGLVLASGSRYRAELLARLRLPFDCAAPQIDESAHPGEPPAALALRLAATKAHALRDRFAQALLIGSDQVATLDGQTLGKPGSRERARLQLATCSGRQVEFITAVAVDRPNHMDALHAMTTTRVRFRALDDAAIDRYLDAEDVLDCAGSFKCEGYGITLFEAIEAEDPSALIGLPLIALARLLRQAGLTLP